MSKPKEKLIAEAMRAEYGAWIKEHFDAGDPAMTALGANGSLKENNFPDTQAIVFYNALREASDIRNTGEGVLSDNQQIIVNRGLADVADRVDARVEAILQAQAEGRGAEAVAPQGEKPPVKPSLPQALNGMSAETLGQAVVAADNKAAEGSGATTATTEQRLARARPAAR